MVEEVCLTEVVVVSLIITLVALIHMVIILVIMTLVVGVEDVASEVVVIEVVTRELKTSSPSYLGVAIGVEALEVAIRENQNIRTSYLVVIRPWAKMMRKSRVKSINNIIIMREAGSMNTEGEVGEAKEAIEGEEALFPEVVVVSELQINLLFASSRIFSFNQFKTNILL